MLIRVVVHVTMSCKNANAWNISTQKLSKLDE